MKLIDRSRELGLLTELLARAAEGTSAAVVLRGEPGIGKTALLDAAAARAVTEGMAWTDRRCSGSVRKLEDDSRGACRTGVLGVTLGYKAALGMTSAR